jgi:hypothetical protein
MCTVTETEPVKTSGPLAATSADGLRSEQEQLSRGPDAKAPAAHNDAKKNDRAEDPDKELEYEKKKKEVSDLVPTQNKMQSKIFY